MMTETTYKPNTYAVLNIDALLHNFKKVREYARNAKIMAVIKANAYGHGLLRVAKALPDADAFAVARIDEAMQLRDAGIRQRIIVLEGFACNEDLLQVMNNNLDVVIHNFQQIELLENCVYTGKNSIWLKLDTGMNRLGFNLADFAGVYQILQRCKSVSSIQLMTHLANADNKQDNKTLLQIAKFEATVADFAGTQSIANSAGILAWKASHKNWVRPGIMLYGVSPFSSSEGIDFDLQAVMSLHSQLLAVKKVEAGGEIGYGGQWICKQTSLIGIVALGYGDGYPRQVKAGTPVLVNNIRVPIIGRISMDMMAVDLQECTDATIGDPVILWGEGLAVEEVAKYANTIPYALLCCIAPRVNIIERRSDVFSKLK